MSNSPKKPKVGKKPQQRSGSKLKRTVKTDLLLPDTGLHNLGTTCVPLIEEKGEVREVLGITHDFTERKRAEKELQESKEFTENLIASMQDGFSVLDNHGVHIDVNPAFCQMTGFSREELIGVGTPHRYWPPEAYEEIEKAFQKTLRCEISDIELTFMRKNGEHFPVIVSPSWIKDEQGNVTSYFATVKDITERKRTEETLKKSIQFLNDTGEMAKVGGWELDLSTKEVSWTEEVGRIHGVEPGYKPKLEEAIKFYAPESRPDVEAVVKKAAETGEPYDLESLFIPSGSKDKIWVRSLGRAVYSGGKIVKLVGTFQNIDKYKRAEDALRVSLEKYRVLFESFPLGITISDKSGKIIEGNRQSEQLLGITREAHAQRRIDSKEWQIIQKDGTPMPADEYASTRALRENRLIENVEMGIVKDKGEITWISVTAAPIPLEGYGVAIAYGDITERKRAEEALRESEQRYRSLFDGVPISLYRTSPDGQIVDANLALVQMLGYPDRESLHAVKVFDTYVNPEDRQSWQVLIKQERMVSNFEKQLRRYDGSKIWVEENTRAVYGPEGEVLFYEGSFQDITERKRTEKERDQLFEQVHASRERLRNLTRRLVEVQEVERRGLVRKLHDEVGQSLTALSINLNIVNNQLPPETATKMATRIDDSLKLVEETVERIRDVMAELRPPVLDDYGLMAALNWYGRQFSERTGIATAVEGEELIPRLPLATETALFRITQEALTNVAKHGQAKQVIISLKSGEEKIYLTIADDGIGFEQQQQQQQQWGLINMRERAQAVGGTLNIETAPGKGTKVIVEIQRNN